MRSKYSWLIFAACVVRPSLASADMPPGDGSKSVPYRFIVHGLDAVGPAVAVFSYPCSGSNGQPGEDVTLLAEGTSVSIGRNESCAIYQTKRSTYDQWKAEPATSASPPDATGLVNGATKCSGGPSPLTTLDKDDPRNEVVEDLDVRVDATSCRVTSRGVPSRGGCSASGGSPQGALAILLTLPALGLLLRKRRATA